MLAGLVFACLASLSGAQEFFTLKGHGGPIKGIATGPDGTILTASFDNTVGVWRNHTPVWLDGHDAAVNAVAFLNNQSVVSAGDDFSVRLWDIPTRTSHLLGYHAGKVIRLAASADGRRVASASWDGTARIWSPFDGALPITLRGHTNVVNDVAFSPDSRQIYTASADGTIRIWDVGTGSPVERLVRHGFGINTLIISPDSKWLAYGAVDGAVRVISLSDETFHHDFTAGRRPILAMAYNPVISQVAVGDAHGYIMMIDTLNWRISKDFRATIRGPIWALAFSPNGENIHAGGLDNAMYSWPVTGLSQAPTMAGTPQSYHTPPSEMSNGERQFQLRCSICHTVEPEQQRRAGPTLYNLFGRNAGTVENYKYSETLQNSDIIWSEATIDSLFDQGPDHYIPGSKMPMQRITGSDDRADLIAYLKSATRTGQPRQKPPQ